MKNKLTKRQIEDLERLKAMPDEEIKTDDIPPLTDEFWKKAVHNPFYRPTKEPTTIRIDSDVLLWLKGQGRGYQTRINQILRKAMLNEMNPKSL